MPQIILNGIDNISDIVNDKYLLVCDSAFEYLPIKDKFNTAVAFSDFTPNPLYDQVCKGVEMFNKHNCKAIVAVGGGSAIDVAKCIKLYCKMDHSVNYLTQEKFDSSVLLVAVPTTAGTGSESTCHAVIYYNGVKQSVSHKSIVPDYAVLEPSVLKTLPLYQKKCTMLDALCQGIESWWSVNSNAESKAYAQAAVKGIVESWREYIEDNTYESAEKIMYCANKGGQAINITATTAAHAMSYKLTSLYNIPHGHAVAICLSEVWEYMLNNTDKCIDSRGEVYLKGIFEDIERVISLKKFREMLNEMGIENPVSDKRAEDIAVLTDSVNPTRLKNNPVKLETAVLCDMYERIVK